VATGPSPQLRAVLGAKVDRWLVYTVAGLLVCIGAAQLTSTPDDAGEKALEALGCATWPGLPHRSKVSGSTSRGMDIPLTAVRRGRGIKS
jgi:hypothetical protein